MVIVRRNHKPLDCSDKPTCFLKESGGRTPSKPGRPGGCGRTGSDLDTLRHQTLPAGRSPNQVSRFIVWKIIYKVVPPSYKLVYKPH